MSLININKWLTLSRGIEGTLVPDGHVEALPAGKEVSIVHELGGDFTLRTQRGKLYRIQGIDADAIGREIPLNATVEENAFSPEIVLSQLKRCYDPEIPVDIVELGLIYDHSHHKEEDGSYRVEVTMTLTAPGCGMGQVLVDDVQRKLLAIPQVTKANVNLVFDPPWTPERMSDAARLEAGLL